MNDAKDVLSNRSLYEIKQVYDQERSRLVEMRRQQRQLENELAAAERRFLSVRDAYLVALESEVKNMKREE